MPRQNISGNSPYEGTVGYSRAVRVGNYVHVAGTTAMNQSGMVTGVGNAYKQAQHVLENIRQALEKAGATMEQVVRTRMYIISLEDWDDVAKAHSEVFYTIRPAATMVVVAALLNEDMLVEIEADAYVGPDV